MLHVVIIKYAASFTKTLFCQVKSNTEKLNHFTLMVTKSNGNRFMHLEN